MVNHPTLQPFVRSINHPSGSLSAAPRQHIFIVVENPEDALRLVEGGVPIKKLNIGNMHMAEGKRQVAGSVAVDDADVAAFKRLQELGVELEIRRVPTEHAENIEKLFK